MLYRFFQDILFQKKGKPAVAAYVFMVVFLVDCQTDKSELIAEQVAERVKKYRADQIAERQQKLLDEASKSVDSLLLNEARDKLLDSLGNVRPIKPPKPEKIPPIDTAVVKPLF